MRDARGPAGPAAITAVGEAPFGTWRYAEWRPPALAGAVELLWAFEGASVAPRKRVLPNGCLELIVNLSAPYRLVRGAGPETLRAGWVGGLLDGPIIVEQPDRQCAVGARLRPAGALALLRRPLQEITGRQVDLGDLVGRDGDALIDACAGATSLVERLRRLADWIAGRIARAPAADPAVAWCAARIVETGGGVGIAALRERTGLSKGRLAAAFREQVGMLPKRYARVVRFRRVLGMLQAGVQPLVEVALAAGYCDQAHMSTEFRALAGMTPGAFVAARHPVGDGSTATEPPAGAHRAA